ncbi:MAG TPA: hypothetical protein VIU16_09075, partial [Gaiellaceae bacterium]
MSERRHTEPLPLGGRSGLPYSKGLMSRALMVTGVPADRAYELAVGEHAGRHVLAGFERNRLPVVLDPEVGEVVGDVDPSDERGVVLR